MNTTTAVARKPRPRRLTKRQQAQVERLYPMARAVGRSYQHRNADGMDRAHDFVLGVIGAVKTYRPDKGPLKPHARRAGKLEMFRLDDWHGLVHTPTRERRLADPSELQRNRSHVPADFVGAPDPEPVEAEDEDAVHVALRGALRRLDPRDAELLERLYVREEAPADVARDLGLNSQIIQRDARRAVARLRSDREFCRATGTTSFYDSIPIAPDAPPPNCGGMRPAAAFLKAYNGNGGIGVAILRLFADSPGTLAHVGSASPLNGSTNFRWVNIHVGAGFLRCTLDDGVQTYSLAPKGRRLLEGVRRLEEWRAGRGASS